MKEDLFTPDSIRTRSGKYLNIALLSLDTIVLEDIAHALSYAPRFAGHTKHFYSVAQHSVEVSKLCLQHPRAGLLHDASEAYLADIPSPFKRLLPDYRRLENVLMRAIAEKFDFCWPLVDEIKTADMICLQWEWDNVVLGDGVGWPPEVAKAKFLDRWRYVN